MAKRGHEVKLMSPRFVRPYVKSNKNDARDAEAICEAVTRPAMRFVVVATGEISFCLTMAAPTNRGAGTRDGAALLKQPFQQL
jgi:hypothetical protein